MTRTLAPILTIFLAASGTSETMSGQAARPVTPPLEWGGVISGQVLQMDGTPALKTSVWITRADSMPAITVPLPTTNTDAQGHYRLENLAPGVYCLYAGVQEGTGFVRGCSGEYRVLGVGFREMIPDVDIRLTRPAGVRVAGRVVIRSDDGTPDKPAFGLRVRLAGEGRQVSTSVEGDGSFEFFSVSSGIHRAFLDPRQMFSDAYPPQEIQVPALGDLEGLEFVIPRSQVVGALLTSTVSVDGGGPIPRTVLELSGPSLPKGTRRTLPVPVDDEDYRMSLPAGQYRVTVQPISWNRLPTGYSLKSLMAGSVNLMTNQLELQPNDFATIEVTLEAIPPPWVRVKGHVTGADSDAVSSRTLVLNTNPGIAVRPLFAPISEEGSFEFPAVLPGDYSAYLIPLMDSFPRIMDSIVVGNTDVADLKIPARLESFKITGRMTGEATLRASGVIPPEARLNIVLQRSNRRPPGNIRAVIADDGTFEFSTVAPGAYTSHLVRGISDVGLVGQALQTIVVTDADVAGVDIDLTRTPPP